MASTPITVGQLTRRLKGTLEAEFGDVVVLGEISALKEHTSGHVYLTLKDEEARMECVVYRTTVQSLRYRPPVGALVVVYGRITLYEVQGRLQMVISWIEQAGRGKLQAAFDALKARLDAEGLFASGRKRPLPFLPRAVGVVTSPVGAARRDIEAVVHRRSPQIPVIVSPSPVEGVDSAPHIVRALERLARHPEVDVIIVGRGGGSLESLWGFNTEIVARAIAACPKPVISAVGHETDTTIADLVADRRAPTPSAAAELAVPERDALLYTLEVYQKRLGRALTGQLVRAERRLERAVTRLEALTRTRLEARRRRVEALRRRLAAVEPAARLVRSRARLEAARARLVRTGERRLRAAHDALAMSAARLEALSPLGVLSRGYSITRSGGRVVRRFDGVAEGAELEILLQEGRLTARVTGAFPPASTPPTSPGE